MVGFAPSTRHDLELLSIYQALAALVKQSHQMLLLCSM